MGWFLGGTSKKKGRASTRGKSKSAKGVGPSWDPQRTIFAAKVLVGFAVLVTLVVGWRWSETWLREYVKEEHGQAVAAEDVLLGDTGRIPMLAVEQLQEFVAEHVTGDPLDGESLRVAARLLERDAWVRELRQLRRLSGGRVLVEAEYRQPMAMIEDGGVYHVVDGEGIRLPALYMTQRTDVDLPLIVGVASGPGPVGEVWPGRDVQAGLALVSMLEHEAFADQIRAYDVSGRDPRGRLRLSLWTTGGGVVRWGLPPGEEPGIETRAAEKVLRLREVDERRGAIDAGGKVVDVYGATTTIQVSQPVPSGGEPMSAYTLGR
ncbi:cell division protein FtsQ/DivIB [Phycisphaerales bacterium AB-hyl4]|uniref:Cell division protein FtsQ/DivIB n=1 Tax=Natronomicrosphaera hydrolytica TaxID=3242702 RepID=A0ABV4U363_9BACT